jgi:hypothetical protein
MEQELVQDLVLQGLLVSCYDKLGQYEQKIQEISDHLTQSIFYNSLEKYIRNEKLFKEELKNGLCAKDADFLQIFNKTKFSIY